MASSTIGDIKELMDMFREIKDRSINSLSEYTKKTMIISRAYIEDSVAKEDGITHLMKFCNQMLGGLVISSIGLNDVISGGRTVRQLAQMISTEDFHNFLDIISNEFGDTNIKISAGLEDNAQGDKDKLKEKELTVKDIKNDPGLYAGRLLEVNITGEGGAKIPLYFYVQITPYVTPTSVMEQFVDSSFTPSMLSRWAKFKAGEISFWKDFVLEADLVRKRRKALKADKDGILREIEDRRSKQRTKSIMNNSALVIANHNCASSILVISRRTMDRIMKDQGLDYRRFDVRQNIMKSTMSLMMAVFDPNYGTVDFYMDGIEHSGNYSIDHIKESVGKGDKDAVDLKTLMTVLASGSMPRF